MEKKIESLRNNIKANTNLSEEFKCNLGTLTDTMVTVFPDYNYSNYESILNDLNVKNSSLEDCYARYNPESKTIEFDTSKIFDDRID